jgi:hypothetical protein
VAELKHINIIVNATQAEEVHEFCREEVKFERCGAPAEFILWGKLFPADALGPRCYDHAADHVGHYLLTGRGLEQSAILDLRGLYRAGA